MINDYVTYNLWSDKIGRSHPQCLVYDLFIYSFLEMDIYLYTHVRFFTLIIDYVTNNLWSD